MAEGHRQIGRICVIRASYRKALVFKGHEIIHADTQSSGFLSRYHTELVSMFIELRISDFMHKILTFYTEGHSCLTPRTISLTKSACKHERDIISSRKMQKMGTRKHMLRPNKLQTGGNHLQ